VLAFLKADAGVLALIAADHIHGQVPLMEPQWPFIKTQAPQTLPLRADCVDGATINFGISAFSRGQKDGSGALIETAEDHAGRIGEAIETAIDKRKSDIPGIGTVVYRIADMTLLVDGDEPGAFHYSCTVRARALAEV
jgi:hypothetical protein